MPQKIILHVLVVGFHHKKGCQLEYSYPPLIEGHAHDSSELPEVWKNLPNLALPDGAHNYDADYAYFILPALDGGKESVYGISCYRQIDAQALENRTPDITRGSVQKSVVVLSSLPLYGALRTRLELITHAYFEGKDFSKVDLLADTFTSLSNCMTPSALDSQINCDLSVRDLILTFKHDLLVLFKLMLLERRIIMYHSPTSELTSRMLALVSLLPGFLRCGGLRFASYIEPIKLTSVESFVDIRTSGPSPPGSPKAAAPSQTTADPDSDSELALNLESARLEIRSSAVTSAENSPSGPTADSPEDAKEQDEDGVPSSRRQRALKSLTSNMSAAGSFLKVKLVNAASTAGSAVTSVASRTRSTASAASESDLTKSDTDIVAEELKFDDPRTQIDEFGMPLPLYSQSNIFLPYVSLHNLDILENPSVRAYFIGANNMLYMQKKHLVDCFIGSSGSELTISDPELRRSVQLTAADLRFVDCLYNTVLATVPHTNTSTLEDQQQQEDVFENTDWDGSDEWLRLQFREYLLTLLKTCSGENRSSAATTPSNAAPVPLPGSETKEEEPKEEETAANGISNLVESTDEPQASGDTMQAAANPAGNPADFNPNFLRLLRSTRHYRAWSQRLPEYVGFAELPAVHPAHGQWKLDDLQLRINHMLSHSEQGRRLNNAVQNTGKMVHETGKAVGSAITNARSAVSSLWTGISKTATNRFSRAPQPTPASEPEPEPTADASPVNNEQ